MTFPCNFLEFFLSVLTIAIWQWRVGKARGMSLSWISLNKLVFHYFPPCQTKDHHDEKLTKLFTMTAYPGQTLTWTTMGQLCAALCDSQSRPVVKLPGIEPGSVVTPLALRCSATREHLSSDISVGDEVDLMYHAWVERQGRHVITRLNRNNWIDWN